MPVSEALARRFLHVNLNCRSLDATEELYVKQLGLSARMRTDPSAPTDGSILGLPGETHAATSFFYDARGGRNACALEAIQWTTPPLKSDQNPHPARPGIRSALFTVNDLDQYVSGLQDADFLVSDPVTGLISGGKSVLVMDPDGVVIELSELRSEQPGALFAGIRISAVDVAATVDFLTAIGFAVLEAPAPMTVAGDQLAPGGGGAEARCVVARLALPEDRHQFTVSVVQHPETGSHPLPVGGNSQGLYRCALRVDNVEKAVSLLPDSVELQGDPVWCPLPGTKIEGLYVAFMRSPDGVVFEFVERPLKYFTR
ncbi:VOC family protein [uncultured Mycobacterium sp.]|uniref:VOC family protein n=1 Tax=uncultured Mycobacterium sp. TaxID=171292 RepID=UPI0035C96E59